MKNEDQLNEDVFLWAVSEPGKGKLFKEMLLFGGITNVTIAILYN